MIVCPADLSTGTMNQGVSGGVVPSAFDHGEQ
jgi:hypothetical protein